MAPNLFMAHYALYMTSHPRFVTSQHSIHYISLLYLISNWLLSDSTSTVSLSSHPDYQSYNPYCTYENTTIPDITHTICDITATAFLTSYTLHRTSPPGFMTSRPLSLWHHRHYFVNTYQLYLTSNRRCRDSTTPISEITTSICVSVWSHTLYWW